jgi:2,3-bisphosphoglycerate-dependent phosphoglycerate mutase
MFRILLARHGESIWNQDSKFTGWTNIPLTIRGKKEAEQMALTMKETNNIPTIIFTSVLQRSIDTSQIIQKTLDQDIPIHTSWRLNEKHYGTLEGVPRNYIRDLYGEPFTARMRSHYTMKPPKIAPRPETYPVYKNCYFETIKYGESKENVLQRFLPYYENDILYTLKEKKIPLIMTHKHTARVLMKHLLQLNDEQFERYELPKSMILINLDDQLKYLSHSVLETKVER